ncbi:hypothetical protein P0082_04700 [Candidatus Haliotispira prima]|uniref:Uncharacterized protein n=1 Tax=Candidatus Haliotispira prima TaxID=3034016 RepID=A0ABY8MKN4_9SPIO|nr:hypothetical protein P0082_04700 [Candidatus Haliotispira prima]
MTDVKSDSEGETQFNVLASTEFVGATQALVSLTPTKSGTAAFLAVADTETIPSATAAEALLAYREIDFSGTAAQIIQFALSISATQNVTTGEVSGDTGAVLQPSTAYKIVMYSSGSSSTLFSFTTFASVDAGHPIPTGNTILTFNMSAHNFRAETDGRFQVPFVFPWVMSFSLLSEISNGNKEAVIVMGNANKSSTDHVTGPRYTGLLNIFGNSDRGALFLHTPLSGTVHEYLLIMTNGLGNSLTIFYN